MRIDDLGDLDATVLIFGGPVSNLQATRAMRAGAARRGIPAARAICTGDVAAYCADPAATVAEIRDWGCAVVAGNCERQLAARAPDCGCGFGEGSACDRLSAGWYAHADRAIGPGARAWMAGLPDAIRFRHRGRLVHVCHGAFTDISRFLWPSTPETDFLDEIAACPGDIVFSGHSGIPFDRQIGRTRWINAGVIGLPPNDGAPATRYAILARGEVTIHRLSYDHAAARDAMERQGLGTGYHAALTTGIWPSQDILPPDLRC